MIKVIVMFPLKLLLMVLINLRWAYFHINPNYVKFYFTKDEAHFQHRGTGAIHSNLHFSD